MNDINDVTEISDESKEKIFKSCLLLLIFSGGILTGVFYDNYKWKSNLNKASGDNKIGTYPSFLVVQNGFINKEYKFYSIKQENETYVLSIVNAINHRNMNISYNEIYNIHNVNNKTK